MPGTLSREQVGIHVFVSAWLHNLNPLVPTYTTSLYSLTHLHNLLLHLYWHSLDIHRSQSLDNVK